MRSTSVLAFATALALLGAPATRTLSQIPADSSGESPQVGVRASHRQVLSINPIMAVLGFYSAEYERALSETTTLGLGASVWTTGVDVANVSYLSGELKLRYYPSARALSGFSLGITGGSARLSGTVTDGDEENDATARAASVGFEMGYSWLLGARRNVAIGLGAGAKRLFVLGAELDDVTVAYPTARLSVGIAF
ncbi:MAG: DUF3575 domain-containing protein [Gemmatimonadaceae bacterium]